MISKKMQKKSTNQKTNNLISPTFKSRVRDIALFIGLYDFKKVL